MKKILTVFALSFICLSSFAQLRPPTEKASRDTLLVFECQYNGVDLKEEDYPCMYFVETPSKIIIANQVYAKNNPTKTDINKYNDSWGGHIDVYTYLHARVKGKITTITKVFARSDCKDDIYNRKYVFDNSYAFYCAEINYYARRLAEGGIEGVDYWKEWLLVHYVNK